MKIKTNQPLLYDRKKITTKIALFWDQISPGWQKIWGTHIHHGYYENNQSLSPTQAQEKLIEKLSNLLEISSGSNILDVGCGMGGSSFYLAKKYGARVTGITLSKKQVAIANEYAKKNNIGNVAFRIEDALSLERFKDNSFDIIWSLESCEQFFDKNLFIKQAYRLLKPGGKLMLATWCSSQDEYENEFALKYQKLCSAFDVPYMPTIDCYRNYLVAENFFIQTCLDWSRFVMKSWDVGLSLLNAHNFFQLLKIGGWRGFRFAKQIKLMREAFYQDQVRYGVLVASKLA